MQVITAVVGVEDHLGDALAVKQAFVYTFVARVRAQLWEAYDCSNEQSRGACLLKLKRDVQVCV